MSEKLIWNKGFAPDSIYDDDCWLLAITSDRYSYHLAQLHWNDEGRPYYWSKTLWPDGGGKSWAAHWTWMKLPSPSYVLEVDVIH